MKIMKMVTTLVVAISLSACQFGYAVSFANPCAHPVEVHTFTRPADITRDGSSPFTREVIPPVSVVEIEAAYNHSASGGWSYDVEGGRDVEPMPVDSDGLSDGNDTVVVVIPAEVCNGDN